ncbi:HTH-type transcriptional regulator TtgR [Nocardia cerradoensis]|uniref:HTH-type transcriptional regulator TtgR n=1 Tax=Nocardia cerradoensis TaxID=85688 RepID=A0A231H4D2_9NOCA|nr:TetR/AcrR family transcriptional regulator [Nocardia cerradoensis]OXR43724.1 HTH-type transcriptional regulator TtgR [Nocardia cerradoensis]
MGTREDLLSAAKHCLAERGYARTTVRDIVAASGSNLAAINYHFGTRDALLTQAMIESSAEAVQQILDALAESSEPHPAERLLTFLRRLIATFTDQRALWAANIESLAQALHSGEVKADIAAKQREGKAALTRMLLPARDIEDDDGGPIGVLLWTLLDGLLVQWLLDPKSAPSAEQLVAGLRTLAPML